MSISDQGGTKTKAERKESRPSEDESRIHANRHAHPEPTYAGSIMHAIRGGVPGGYRPQPRRHIDRRQRSLDVQVACDQQPFGVPCDDVDEFADASPMSAPSKGISKPANRLAIDAALAFWKPITIVH